MLSHHFMANRWGNNGNSDRLYFLGFQNHWKMVTAAMKLKRHLLLGRKVLKNLDNILKSRDITLWTKVCLVKAMVFPVVMYRCSSHVQTFELDPKKLNTEGLMLLKCGVWEDSWESLGWQGDQTSHSQRKSVLNIHWKDWCWSGSSSTSATWCQELTLWKRPWCSKRLKTGGEGNRGWDGWMASPTGWTWFWACSGSWWWTGKPGMLHPMGLQRVGTTEQPNWTFYRKILLVTKL